ncbi:hypothetical protein Amn_11050 [Aminobacter sp. Y103A]|nr:hypothetical protein Amn_11050 [Aminobacter sp. SS-2016]
MAGLTSPGPATTCIAKGKEPADRARKGGDWPSSLLSPISKARIMEPPGKLPVSPLAGEMAGRPEEVPSRQR